LFVLAGARDTLDDPVSASASQCLGLYPVLKEVLKMQSITCDDVKAAVNCFYSLCDVLDMLRRANVPGAVSPSKLHKAIIKHLREYQDIYGTNAWFPKCHLATHLAKMLKELEMLLACYVHERKHKEVKRFGVLSRSVTKDLLNTNWDTGLLKNMLRVQLQDMAGPGMPNVPAHFESAERHVDTSTEEVLRPLLGTQGAITTGIHAVIRGHIHVHNGDVVSLEYNGQICTGELWYTFQVDSAFLSCVSIWRPVKSADNLFHIVEMPCIVDTHSIMSTMTYRRLESDSTALVVPACV
jgi:hypothetical protein